MKKWAKRTKTSMSHGDYEYIESMVEFATTFDSPETVIDDANIKPELAKQVIKDKVMKLKKIYDALD